MDAEVYMHWYVLGLSLEGYGYIGVHVYTCLLLLERYVYVRVHNLKRFLGFWLLGLTLGV